MRAWACGQPLVSLPPLMIEINLGRRTPGAPNWADLAGTAVLQRQQSQVLLGNNLTRGTSSGGCTQASARTDVDMTKLP